jgi:Tol biopolymer transport system component
MSGKSRKRAPTRPETVPQSPSGQNIDAYVPTSTGTARARTGAGTAVLAIGAILALLALLWLGLSLFAPGVLPNPFTSDNPPTPQPLDAAFPEGRISFLRSNESSGRDLFVVNPDGTNQQQVTTDIVVEGSTSWSPDGRSIAIQANVNGFSTIVRITLGGDNKPLPNESVQLTADIKADSALPAWSPDGSMIAFQSKRDGGEHQVFVMDINGNNKRRLSDGNGFAGQPAWSPDSKSVIYVAGERADPTVPKDMYVAPAAGGEPKKILSRGTSLRRPLWTTDGKYIVCVEGPGDRNQALLVLNADGTSPRVVVDAAQAPQVSPLGDRVAYYFVDQSIGSDGQSIGSDIFVTSITEGSTPTNLTTQTRDDYYPAWSPDASRLAWASIRGTSGHKIVVANPDGSNIKEISTGTGDDFLPLWSQPVK